MVACQSCGATTSATQTNCRECGSALSQTVDHPSKSGSSLWLGIGAAVAVYALITISIYLVWSRSSATLELDDAASASIGTALAGQLPPFLRLDTLNLDDVQRDGSASSPALAVTFSGAAVLTSDLYRQSRTEDNVVFLIQEGVQGMTVALTGTARLGRTQQGWSSNVSYSAAPLLEGFPRASFRDRQTIVEGSPEEVVFLESRDRAIEEARQQEADAKARERQRVLDQRREADRLVAEAQRVERARLLFEEQTALAEKERIEADRRRQAVRDEEARRAAEDALRRQQMQPRTPPVLAGGRVPKGTKVDVRLLTGLRTDLVAVEDRFTAETVDDIVVGGQVVVPAGATVRGVIASVQPATRTKRRAKLSLGFDLLSVGSSSFPMRARAVLNGPGLGRDAVKAGVGAGVGAVIGGLLGGSRGAVLGGAVGGGGTVAATEGEELDLPTGSRIRIEFESPLQLQ